VQTATETQLKPTTRMKKINVRRTSDVRLTAAMCKLPYTVVV
jgi:hypothetical protein